MKKKIPLHFVFCKEVDIFDHLKLEEYLLHIVEENYAFFIESTLPALVLGLSGKKEEAIDGKLLEKTKLPIIKRFSGGGSVVLGKETMITSFIFSKEFFPFKNHGEIHAFMEKIFKQVFQNLPFALRENDYVLEDKKVGGNAQYLTEKKWLHHTSFLYEINKEKMDLLLLPKKRPLYREDRSHTDFLLPLQEFFSEKKMFYLRYKEILSQEFELIEISYERLLEKSFSYKTSLTKKIE